MCYFKPACTPTINFIIVTLFLRRQMLYPHSTCVYHYHYRVLLFVMRSECWFCVYLLYISIYNYHLFPSRSRTIIIYMIITSFPLALSLFFSILLYSSYSYAQKCTSVDSLRPGIQAVPSDEDGGPERIFILSLYSLSFYLF